STSTFIVDADFTSDGLMVRSAAGAYTSTSTLMISYGGTGLSTAPNYGQLLLGQADGTYALTGTSSLGLYTGTIASGTTGWIPYYSDYSNNLTATSAIYIDTSGKIGIGTTSPDYQLTVYDNDTNDYLAYIYNASSTATSGGGLSIRVDGDGQLLNLNHNGTDVVTITAANTTFNNPVTFGSAGDVSMAYDLNFTNNTAASINFEGPGYVRTDSAWENLDLTLSAANSGDVVIDDMAVLVGTTTIADTLYINAFTDRVGVGTSSPLTTLSIQGIAGESPFSIASSTGAPLFHVAQSGNVGIGTTTPSYELTIAGDIILTGGIYDNNYSAGNAGNILMTTGSGVDWVSTSTFIVDADFISDGLMVRSGVGSYDSTTTLAIYYGGTGTSTAPSYGQMLLGQADGSYDLVATSTLGLGDGGSGTVGSGTPGWIPYYAGYGDTLTATSSLQINTAGQILISDGTSGAPSISFSGDTDMGFYRYADNVIGVAITGALQHAFDSSNIYANDAFYSTDDSDTGLRFVSADKLALRTGGNDQLTVNSNGYVGIGTTTPVAELSVYGNLLLSGTDRSMYFGYATTSADGYGIRDNSGTMEYKNSGGSWAGIGSGSGDGTLNWGGEGSLTYYAADGTTATGTTGALLTWDNTNTRLGIGTTTPATTLTVMSDTDSQLRLAYDENNYVNFTVAADGEMTIDTSGTGDSILSIGDTSESDAGIVLDGNQIDFHLAIDDTNDAFQIGTSSTIGSSTAFTMLSSGNIGIGTTTSPSYALDIGGQGNASMGWLTAGADYAEYFYTDNTGLEAGDVVCVDITRDSAVARCERGADSNVMGIVSTRPAIIGNNKEGYRDNEHYKIIGMLGQVPAKVSAENGPIRPGDSLTSASSSMGYVMRADPGDSTVGVALESLASGKDIINVLISRRNKSLTVDMVESRITDRIASMEIEDEVQILIAQAVDNLDLDEEIQPIVDEEIALLNAAVDERLTVGFDAVDAQLITLAASVDDVLARMTAMENNIDSIFNFQFSISKQLSIINDQLVILGSDSASSTSIIITDDGNLKLGRVSVAEISTTTATSTPDVAVVEIVTATTTEIAAFVVNQIGSGDVADFQAGGVSIVNIADTGRVSVVGEMQVDGRLLVCSGGACGSALDDAVDETMGDMGIEGKVVAGAFEGYCAVGYMWVPGSSKYGTLPGFCVSAREASLHAEIDADDYADGTRIGSSSLVWTNISQGEAMLACQELGDGYHLVSENEWLTIAENIIRVSDNDSDDISDGLQLATSPQPSPSQGEGVASTGVAFVLSNDNVIYDFVGGVAEWTDQIITRAGAIAVDPSACGTSPWQGEENSGNCGLWYEYYEVLDYKGFNINPPYYYNSENGIGRIKTITASSTASYLSGFVRGQSALFDLDLSYSPIEATSTIGFRCAR
ncbi:hypothetical protein KAJ89_02690, partial [Candidatus Parcubacteria bacterium]|nr:hypothetical protein [Candidatus Parcubacteria bacterium]